MLVVVGVERELECLFTLLIFYLQEEEGEAEEIVLEESDEEDDKPALYNPKVR